MRFDCRNIGTILLNSILNVIITISCVFITFNFLSKDKETELVHIITTDRRKLFEETSDLIHTRLFSMLRVIWKMEDIESATDINNDILREIKSRYKKYSASVEEYNINVRRITKQLIYVFDNDIARMVSDEKNKIKGNVCITERFMTLHKNISNIISSIENNKNIDYRKKIKNIKNQSDDLQSQIIDFMDLIAKVCFDKESIRQVLDI